MYDRDASVNESYTNTALLLFVHNYNLQQITYHMATEYWPKSE